MCYALTNMSCFCLCVLCRFKVSSPVWRSAALRWGACRKLWKPSGWTSAGWTRTCPRSKNGFNTDAPSSLRPSDRQQGGACRQDNSSVCTIVGLCLLTPFIQARGCALPGWTKGVRLVLWVVFASSGWLLIVCLTGCKHTHTLLFTLYAVDQTCPLQLSSKPHAWADNHASPALLSLSPLSGYKLYERWNGHFKNEKVWRMSTLLCMYVLEFL